MPNDLEKLQGTWHLSSSEVDGAVLGPELLANARVVVAGNRFESLGMGAPYEGTFAIDETAKPKTFDMLITGGHAAGTRHAGLYKFSRGSWILCLASAGALRPRTFACGPDGGFALQTFRRHPAAARIAKQPATLPTTSSSPISATTTPIEGEWSMVSGVFNGAAMVADMVKWCKRVTRGDLTRVLAGPNAMLEARFTLDETTAPWRIDYVNLRGADKGKWQQGIAEIDGETLRVCMAAPGQDRPDAFESRVGDKRSFTTWRRSAA
jgi:uncharacterized protein (TIGR03067 family)